MDTLSTFEILTDSLSLLPENLTTNLLLDDFHTVSLIFEMKRHNLQTTNIDNEMRLIFLQIYFKCQSKFKLKLESFSRSSDNLSDRASSCVDVLVLKLNFLHAHREVWENLFAEAFISLNSYSFIDDILVAKNICSDLAVQFLLLRLAILNNLDFWRLSRYLQCCS